MLWCSLCIVEQDVLLKVSVLGLTCSFLPDREDRVKIRDLRIEIRAIMLLGAVLENLDVKN